MLAPNGELLIQTGDTAGLTSQQHYRPLYLPDHLSFASEKIVVEILRSIGFDIVAICKYPLLENDALTWIKESVKLVWPGQSSRLRYLLSSRRFPDTDMYVRARAQRS